MYARRALVAFMAVMAVVQPVGPAGAVSADTGDAATARDADIRVTVLGGSVSPVDVHNGFVTGYRLDDRFPTLAFVWHRGQLDDLPPLVGNASAAFRVNRQGHVGGNSFDASGGPGTKATLWIRGQGRILVPGSSTDGSTDNSFRDLNDHDQVLIQRVDSTGATWPAVWQDGRVVDAPHESGLRFNGSLMNGRAQVVGTVEDVPTGRLVLWQPGRPVRDLGAFGDGTDVPLDINDRGQVLVLSRTGDDDRGRMFLWDDGSTIDLGTLGGDIAGPFGGATPPGRGLNEHGQAAITLGTASGDRHAALWDDGRLTDLGTLGGASSIAEDIDDQGRIVGEAQVASGDFHAFAWERGHMTDLGALANSQQSVALVIDAGQAVGFRFEPDGTTTGLLWNLR
jgi:probable HAF family extracellular repeat protein